MPNWCSTEMVIAGPKEEIKNLHVLILHWMNKAEEAKDNKRHYKWLGYLLEGAALALDGETYACRGWLSDMDVPYQGTGNTWELRLSYESAWTPCTELWDAVVKKYAPHCEAYWYAEEPGTELFLTNDTHQKFFDFSYVIVMDEIPEDHRLVQIFGNDPAIYLTEKELEEKLQKFCAAGNLEEKMNRANAVKLDGNGYFHIFKVDVVDE